MPELKIEQIQAYRSQTFRTAPGLKIHDITQAIDFVNQSGFIFFWPIKNLVLPSLWIAVAGDRPVADAHDDPGHVTWGWKDSLLGKRTWYYAKVLQKKATMISLPIAPYFYALSENYGAPGEDYLTQYEQGRMTLEAKLVYEAILDNGPLDTIALRKAARLSSPESETRFNRALTDLQVDFKILPIGVADVGAWHYAFIYDIVARHYPELPDQAHAIQEREAYQRLTELYFRSVGVTQLRELIKLFGWRTDNALRAIGYHVNQGLLIEHLSLQGYPGEWIAHANLMETI
jgi:hypothetical protein